MESMGAEYTGCLGNQKGYTPFFDSLSTKGLLCTQAYANGKRSIDALPAIIASLPCLMPQSFILSSFAANNIKALPHVLKSHHYTTAFFHGARNGSMGFDNFTGLAGFQHYYGMNEYPDKKDYDSKWGIFDLPFLTFSLNEIEKFTPPFFATIFSLSAHHPYHLPASYPDTFPVNTPPLLKTIAYSDYALQHFFNLAAQTTWYQNTLFIITADHTAMALTEDFQQWPNNYQIPVLFFAPNDSLLIGKYEHTVQQTDIYPSIMQYIGLPDTIISYGNSIFDDDKMRFAVHFADGLLYGITNDFLFTFANGEIKSISNNQQKNNAEQWTKALMHSYSYRLINNKLYP
jgi:phosphoglycerol transferase MdoB-like AlkP superfamily enzyme